MTPEMRQTLTHVQDYFASHGVSPTMRELARIEGRKSTAGVHRRVHALVEAGYLVRSQGERRKFEPAEANLSAVPTEQLRAELARGSRAMTKNVIHGRKGHVIIDEFAFQEEPRRAGKTERGRQRLIIAVRAACKRQGIDDDTRKDIQSTLIGKASMSDMSLAELGQLLDHFNKGWKGPMGHRAHIGKIKALWWSLYWMGAIDDPGDRAISAFVQRQTGVSALKFLDHRKAFSVIEALKGWLERLGVHWPAADAVQHVSDHTPDYSDLHADRHAILAALNDALRAGDAMHGHYVRYMERALGLLPNHHCWTTAELDTGIRMLGRKLRHMKGKEVKG